MFSTTTMFSPCGPLKPNSAMAAVPSSSSRARYSGSVHARATTLAPFSGPDVVGVAVDQAVHDVQVDETLLEQERLERFGALGGAGVVVRAGLGRHWCILPSVRVVRSSMMRGAPVTGSPLRGERATATWTSLRSVMRAPGSSRRD